MLLKTSEEHRLDLERVLEDQSSDTNRAVDFMGRQRHGVYVQGLEIHGNLSNGLDPIGIVWLRELLRTLATQGKTVLVSSHQLAEMQHTVDDGAVDLAFGVGCGGVHARHARAGSPACHSPR